METKKREKVRTNNGRLTVRENIDALRKMDYREMYAVAKDNGVVGGGGSSFTAFKDELSVHGIDYEKLKYKTLCSEWAAKEKARKGKGRPFLHPDEKKRRYEQRMCKLMGTVWRG
jgi:hypothetical protein